MCEAAGSGSPYLLFCRIGKLEQILHAKVNTKKRKKGVSGQTETAFKKTKNQTKKKPSAFTLKLTEPTDATTFSTRMRQPVDGVSPGRQVSDLSSRSFYDLRRHRLCKPLWTPGLLTPSAPQVFQSAALPSPGHRVTHVRLPPPNKTNKQTGNPALIPPPWLSAGSSSRTDRATPSPACLPARISRAELASRSPRAHWMREAGRGGGSACSPLQLPTTSPFRLHCGAFMLSGQKRKKKRKEKKK